MSGPLDGLKVLDISNVIAGPFAAALLGDFGADVLKVELPVARTEKAATRCARCRRTRTASRCCGRR